MSLGSIDHIVVLMLENRSFDSMLGKLYPKSPSFEGLDGSEQNHDVQGVAVPVWSNTGTDETTMRIPDPDPGELWTDINAQLFGTANVPTPAPTPTMDGFVKNYLGQKTTNPAGDYNAKNVMHYFTSKQVPVISALAQQFAICDYWFASAPCQTWPNRWFVHTGTADRRENNEPIHLPNVETIYNRFEQVGVTDWKIYFHDLAQAHTLLQLWLLGSHFHFYRQFQADCQTGRLPCYSFIEPRYYSDFGNPENDQHPPSVVTLGEQLIADVYNCLRSSKVWLKTLLIITYDEHGGCYDHVAPPPAVAPEAPQPGQAFKFDRYGVRVPAVIVSPYVKQGTIFRHSGAVPYDHTSIIATLRKRFPQLGRPLTARDAAAPDLESVLALPKPDNRGPPRIKALPYAPAAQTAAAAQTKPLNSLQRALVGFAANLPETSGKNLQAHLASIQARPRQPPPGTTDNVHAARTYVKKQVGNFFQSN
ncbi:MAG: alkaline phosphatase family protein [Rhodoplanes sp.]